MVERSDVQITSNVFMEFESDIFSFSNMIYMYDL